MTTLKQGKVEMRLKLKSSLRLVIASEALLVLFTKRGKGGVKHIKLITSSVTDQPVRLSLFEMIICGIANKESPGR